MMYDIQLLLDHTNLIDVIQQLGIPYKKAGNKYFCLCPDHLERLGKSDNNISNCEVSEDRYYCYVCGGHGNAINFIQKYYKNELKKEISLPTACEILSAFAGGKEMFLDNNNIKRNFPLTNDELSIIGLTNKSNCLSYVNGTNDKEEGKKYKLYYKNGEYLKKQIIPYNIFQLYYDDEETFNWLILTKACDFMNIYKKQLEMTDTNDFIEIYDYLNIKKKFNIARQIYINFGGKHPKYLSVC